MFRKILGKLSAINYQTLKVFNIGNDVSMLSKHAYWQYDLRDWSEIIFGGSNQPRQIFVRQFCELKYDSLGAFV